jgi:hypothetical protein
MNRRLDPSLAEELLSVKDGNKQSTLANLIADRRLSLRITRKLLRDVNETDREIYNMIVTASNVDDGAEQVAGAAANRKLAHGVTPLIQRQQAPKGQEVTREEVQEALTLYLQKVLEVEGGQELRVTAQVRQAVEMLFRDNLGGLMSIQIWLSSITPGSPAEFARGVTSHLPPKIPRDRLTWLSRDPTKAVAAKPKSFADAAAEGLVRSLHISTNLPLNLS